MFRWSEVEEDHPIPLLHRRIVRAEKAMVGTISMEPGCHVASHCHPSDQISLMVTGHGTWTIGQPGTPECRQVPQFPGEVHVIPGGVYHAFDVHELTEMIDVLSPPGAMGVDSQKA